MCASYISPLRLATNFERAWVRLGKPMATVVLNEDNWTLIGDIQKDPLMDAYVDSNGDKVKLSGIWSTTDIRIVPTAQDSILYEVGAGALEESGRVSFLALEADRDVLKDCFRVIVDNKQYSLEQLQITPHTVVRFLTLTLTLWSGDEYAC